MTSATAIPVFPIEALDAHQTDALVRAFTPAAKLTADEFATAAKNLSAVRDAKANAVTAIETSETEEAVAYRELRDKVAAKDAEAKAALEAELEAVRKVHAEKNATLEAAIKMSEERKLAALAVEESRATSGIDTVAATKAYTEALVGIQGVVTALVGKVPELAKFKPVTALQFIKGATHTNKNGNVDGPERPRFDQLTVTGGKHAGTVVTGEEVDGKVSPATLSGVAKLEGLPSVPGILASMLKVGNFVGNKFANKEAVTWNVNHNGVDYTVVGIPADQSVVS